MLGAILRFTSRNSAILAGLLIMLIAINAFRKGALGMVGYVVIAGAYFN